METDNHSATEVELSERYYQETILQLHLDGRTGILRTSKGRDVPFAANSLRLIGATSGFTDLRAVLLVGFDLDRTSHGLCVTTIRVYET